MKTQLYVFDFDKTLTNKDTLFGYYRTVSRDEKWFQVKRGLIIIAGVIYKVGFIDNDQLKELGFRLFLKNKEIEKLETAAREYSKSISFNLIYKKYYQDKTKENKIVISASPEIYLKYIFDKENFAGSVIRFKNGKADNLELNMFGKKKKRYLQNKGIHSIKELYTDSYTDSPLMEIAENVYLVEGEKIKKVK